MNKKGQFEHPILILAIMIIGMLIIGVIVLKVVTSVLEPFSSAVGNQSVAAGAAVTSLENTFVTFWDFVLVSFFLANIIILFISAFLIDAHPLFVVVYIIFGLLLVIFAPSILDSVNKIYDSPTYASSVIHIPMTDFIRTYFGMILVGIFFVTGVIIYAKIRMGGAPR